MADGEALVGALNTSTWPVERLYIPEVPVSKTFVAHRYRVYRNLTIFELQTIITRQNRVQLRRPNDDLSCLASLNAVLKSQKFFKSIFNFNLNL
jgi:hypothetical protein